MPNWCNNTLTLMHEDPAKLKEVAAAFEDGELFEHFVPAGDNDRSTIWGTKWDTNGGEIVDLSEDGITLVFDTAWSPPVVFYGEMEKLGFDVEASFCEWGMEFVGRYSNGEVEEYTFDNMPEDLDEEWGISETKAMWEEEEE